MNSSGYCKNVDDIAQNKNQQQQPHLIENEPQPFNSKHDVHLRNLIAADTENWKAVGHTRRASFAAPSSSSGYFEELLGIDGLSPGTPLPLQPPSSSSAFHVQGMMESPVIFSPSRSPSILAYNDPIHRSPSTPPGYSRHVNDSSLLRRKSVASPLNGFSSPLATANHLLPNVQEPLSLDEEYDNNYGDDKSIGGVSQIPIFQFFGGRNHGARSFSFNLGVSPQDTLMMSPDNNNSPADDSNYSNHGAPRRKDSSPLARRGLSPLDEDPIFGPNSNGTENWDPISNPIWEASSKQQHYLQSRGGMYNQPQQAGLFHRRVSTYSNQSKQPWENNSNIYLKARTESMDSYRRASTATVFKAKASAPTNSKELADRYFSRDPSLLERRHTEFPARMQDMVNGISNLDIDEELPTDFSAQYGNLLENSNLLATPLTSSLIQEEENRLRSWSDPPRVTKSFVTDVVLNQPYDNHHHHQTEQQQHVPHHHRQQHHNDLIVSPSQTPSISPIPVGATSPATTAALINTPANALIQSYGPLYIVEFKGGRNDLFHIPSHSNMEVKLNDLVIVEADRGKDLGKVVLSDIQDLSNIQYLPGAQDLLSTLLPPSSSIINTPKTIYRHALGAEVAMLLDKARDESKAMSICVAKSKQKNLPMEIVDAEYQWDRKKLTFYFVSDARIDFRDLVKDLFKIYKTRIWMCSVERHRPGIKLYTTN